jgi:protein TonB
MTALAAAAEFSAYDDPMSKVFDLDSQSSGVVAWLGYMLGAIAMALGLMVLVRAMALIVAMTSHVGAAASAPQEIDVTVDPPIAPPTATAESQAKPEPAPPPPRVAPHEAPPPPPAPAQAGKVLTREPDPNEPVDLTGNTIVTGNADAYAGGVTTSNGTSTNAVRGLASPTGTPGGVGTQHAPPAPVGPDLSRAAGLLGNHEWNAPFPPEADTAQIDDAYVTLQVEIRADGTPAAVHVVSDPGNGFGREARRYAMTQRYQSARDHDGNPIPGMIKTVRVHFQR